MEQQNIRQIAFDFYTELCRNDEEFANYFTPKIEDYQNWIKSQYGTFIRSPKVKRD